MRVVTLALAGLLTGTQAFASGDALVIGNSTYNGVQTLFGATDVANAAEALRAQGFDVAEARDADARSMDMAFESFVNALEGDEGPVVVLLAGAFLHGSNGTYLLPARDGAALDDAVVLVEAFPVEAALSVLASFPGQAFLVLGESAVEPVAGAFLQPGLGDLEVPAGVTLLYGPESEVARFAATDLAAPGVRIIEAAEEAGLNIDGFAPAALTVVIDEMADGALPDPAPVDPEAAVEPDTPVAEVAPEPEDAVVPETAEAPAAETAPEPMADSATAETAMDTETETVVETASAEEATDEDTRSDVEIAADNAAWRVARIENSEASYEAYLEALPNGEHANAARQRIKAIRSDPFYDLRRAEDLIGLSREARREIQRDLDELDLYFWAVDGIFGDGTRDAIRSWQKLSGLEETGYLDLEQIARLEADANATRQAEEEAEAARRAEAEAEARRQREAAAAAAAEAEAPAPRRAVPSDAAMWAEVERLGTEAAVRRYLANHPNGQRAQRARQMLQVIERMRGG